MKCGKPLVSEQSEFCTDCGRKTFSFHAGFSVFLYDDVMRQAVADFKYSGKREFADFFAEEMAKGYRKRMEKLGIEALIPVPIHPSRKRYRGYNQAEVLCRELARRIHIPMIPDFLERKKKTVPQKELDAADRIRNLEEAICINPVYRVGYRLPYRVALVDDIYTTGSTAEACTRVMKRSGIEEVYPFSLCIGTDQ